MHDLEKSEEESGREGFLAPLDEGQTIRLASRIGVWGTLAGFGSFLALGTGFGLGHDAAEALAITGLFFGGLGIAAAGALVLRAVERRSGRVMVAAGASIPLGLSISLLGLQTLLGATLPAGLETFAVSVIVITSAVLMVVIGSGAWVLLRDTKEPEDEAV